MGGNTLDSRDHHLPLDRMEYHLLVVRIFFSGAAFGDGQCSTGSMFSE